MSKLDRIPGESRDPCGAEELPLPPAQKEFTLELGCFAKPFSEQLSAQGLPFDPEIMGHLDRDGEAASRLKVRGVLTYSIGNAAYDKIAKRVWAEVARSIKVAREHSSPRQVAQPIRDDVP